MAKTTRVVLTCDLHGDGTEAVTTIRLENGGPRVELDGCQAHLDELTRAGRRASAPRSGRATRSVARRAPRARKATKASWASTNGTSADSNGSGRANRRNGRGSAENAAVREWARENGYQIKERG